MTTLQPFNVYGDAYKVFPPIARAKAALPEKSDSYYLMTHESAGPQPGEGPKKIDFWHNACHPETVVTLKGSYTIQVGDQRITQNEGDVLVLPTGVYHGKVETTTGYRNLQIENTHAGCQTPPKNA